MWLEFRRIIVNFLSSSLEVDGVSSLTFTPTKRNSMYGFALTSSLEAKFNAILLYYIWFRIKSIDFYIIENEIWYDKIISCTIKINTYGIHNPYGILCVFCSSSFACLLYLCQFWLTFLIIIVWHLMCFLNNMITTIFGIINVVECIIDMITHALPICVRIRSLWHALISTFTHEWLNVIAYNATQRRIQRHTSNNRNPDKSSFHENLCHVIVAANIRAWIN